MLREAARGQVYALQIPDIRNGNSETVALCHLPSATHGMRYKRDDFWAICICLSCHDVIGGRVPYDWRVGGEEEVLLQVLYLTIKQLLPARHLLILRTDSWHHTLQ
ncbi:DUF1364 domain-containing protein [Pectobacterium carotovorum]|uniref:nuclease domain-containing protein n=1 Tax=Pectobacterium carotovorum TaxID=554 RepID=UPI0010FE8994|nr:nuclease domain-containing protein [Pectobacterium carotovorum]KAA3668078.1 DUF1364 domain-containing protein [Pectobacterium carotovorum subsp. carotovorum]UCZ77866.1 DUF1364 domain-containing protein [Pectobacterium carotovorum]